MNKDEAVKFMITKIEEIERARLDGNFSIATTKQKKEVVESIIKALKGIEIENED